MTFKIPAADGPKGLSERSRSRLQGVHPDLVKVIERAAEIGPPFIVTEGLRSLERQRELVKKGASRTLKSRHITGHAVDVADVEATYAPQKMKAIIDAVKQAAKDCGVSCEYGIDWGWDSPHIQLHAKTYPAKSPVSVTEKVSQAVGVAASARAVGGAIAGTGATVAASNPETVSETVSALPAVPEVFTETIANGSAWQAIGDEAWKLVNWFAALPLWAQAPLVCSVALVAFWPQVSAFLTPSSQESEQSG